MTALDQWERAALQRAALDMPGWVDANRSYGRTFVRYLFRGLAERHDLHGYEPL